MAERLEGGCLCGAVRYSVADGFAQMFLCHCGQCRKITGSAHASNLFTQPAALRWEQGKEHVLRYDDPERDFTRAFCRKCGCGLPFVTKSGSWLIVPAGSLEGEPTVDQFHRIFHAERTRWQEDGLMASAHAGFPEAEWSDGAA